MRLGPVVVFLALAALACSGKPAHDDDDDDGFDSGRGGVPGSDLLGGVEAACENYFAAVGACLEEYGDATGTDVSAFTLSDTYCEDTYGDVTDRESADYLNCLANVYATADCSSAEGYTEASRDAGDCHL